MIEFSNYAWFLFLWNRYKEEINLDKPQRSEHTIHVPATDRGEKSSLVYRLGNKCNAPSHSNKSLCVYWRISAKIFVSATEFCCRKMLHKFNLTDSVRLDAMTKFCCGDKNFCKNSPVHTKWFVAATCCLVCSIPKVFKCCFWKTFPLNTNFPAKHWEWQYYMYMQLY